MAARPGPLPLAHVRAGRAVLRQQDRVTRLEVTPPGRKAESIALTNKGPYPQGRNAPFAAKLVAEVPRALLIFTDSFASNPGNVQGECGASETGERFLHVVSLTPPGRETLSVQVESCLADLEPERGMPVWNEATRTLTVRYTRKGDGPASVAYRIAEDGTPTTPRPEALLNAKPQTRLPHPSGGPVQERTRDRFDSSGLDPSTF